MNALPPGLVSALTDRYRLERELGQGGMATVYLAHDLRHDRKVAVKVLRPELSAILGGERFLVEIKTTANLQHPHILPLHDSGEAAGLVFYVMPYVEGESLRSRLTREHQLPVAEALRIASEVADALQYAHEHGVVHRDIKPENILLHGGHALVADFGIALAASRSDTGSRMTETGMSLGTPHYMSPEQAMGEREVTPKADIYALGCVLYEMLCGEPPFTGPTAQAIVARVMTEEPRSLVLQRKSIPPHIEAAVARALEKLPADRFGTAQAFAEALAQTGATTAGLAPTRMTRGAPAHADRFRAALPWATAVLALVLGLAAGARFLARPAAAAPLRLSITIPGETPPIAIRLSPDGKTLAYISTRGGRSAIYLRRLDELEARRLDGTEDAASIGFSPDGEDIAFMTGQSTARRVSVRGGGAITIPIAAGGTILASNTIAFAGPDRFVVPERAGLAKLGTDGIPHRFAAPDSTLGETALALDQVLPDGSVLARPWRQPPNGPVVVIDPSTGRRVMVLDLIASWSGYADGILAWTLADGTLFAAPFDLSARRLKAPGQPVGATVLSVLGFVPPVTIGPGGLAYVPTRPRALVRVTRAGQSVTLLGTDRNYHNPRLSPDGRRISLDFTEQVRDFWLFDIADSTLTRFGFDSTGHDAEWLRDGTGLLFAASRGSAIGVFRRRFESGGTADSVFVGPEQVSVHTTTPDGRTGIGVLIEGGSFDLVSLDLAGSGGMKRLLQTPYTEGWPMLSTDGRWLAYQSDESGRMEVYVRAWPGLGGKVQISQNGGTEPTWSRDGKELFYRSAEAEPWLIAAAIEVGSIVRVRTRTPLFQASSYEFATPHRNYDVFPDGRSFAMVRQGEPGQKAEVVYLQNVPGLIRPR